MADNVAITAGSGTTIAADDVGGVLHQRVKLSLGANNTAVDAGAGAGAVGTDTQRVTLGSDDPAVASLAIMDDWDESDRAKVNIIAGQAGIAGGTGVDGATVPRVTLATNVALPAGTNAIGKLAANSGVDIGDVDITSLIPGVGATNLGKAEDAAHSSGDVGVMALAVRQDSQSDFGADGDYVPMSIDGDGALRVAIISGAGSGGTAAADDADFTATSTSGTPAMGVFESSPTNVTDGDMGIVGITTDRRLKTSGIVTSLIPGTTATSLGKAEDAAHTSGDTGVMSLFVRQDSQSDFGADGDYVPGRIDADGNLAVLAKIDPTQIGSLGIAAASGSVSTVMNSDAIKYVTVDMTAETTAVDAGDVVAATQIVAACTPANDAPCTLHSIHIVDPDDQGANLKLVFFDANTTLGTEDSAPDIDDTEAQTVLGVIDVPSAGWVDLGANRCQTLTNVGLTVKPATGTDDIYMAIYTPGTPTYAGGHIYVRLGFV